MRIFWVIFKASNLVFMRISFEGHKKGPEKWECDDTQKSILGTELSCFDGGAAHTHPPTVIVVMLALVVVLGRVNPLKWALFFPNGISNLFSPDPLSPILRGSFENEEKATTLIFANLHTFDPRHLLLLVLLLLILLWLAFTQCLKIAINVA